MHTNGVISGQDRRGYAFSECILISRAFARNLVWRAQRVCFQRIHAETTSAISIPNLNIYSSEAYTHQTRIVLYIQTSPVIRIYPFLT